MIKLITYTVMVEMNGTSEELEFVFNLEEIEEDGLCTLMNSAIENHIQETYCSCTFSEAQNHCDCDNDYNGYKITNRENTIENESKKNTLEALLEISIGKEKSINELVDFIYDGNIEIVEATKCAKALCYGFSELVAVMIIGKAFEGIKK